MASIDTVLQNRYFHYQKNHLPKIAPNINDISQKRHLTTTLLAFWSTTNTLLVEPTTTIRHRRVIEILLWSRKNSTLKSHDHDSESYNKVNNHSAQSLVNNLWAFFRKVYHFCKALFFMTIMFVYFRWIICHVPFL